MATLAIKNTIFTLTSGVGVDEYTQSGHGPSPALKLLNASCSDAVILMGSPAPFAGYGLVSLRQSKLRKSNQASPDLFHCNGRIFALVRMRLDPRF
jgi:hypothetical protein